MFTCALLGSYVTARPAHATEPAPTTSEDATPRTFLADLDPAALLARGMDAERELEMIRERIERAVQLEAAADFVAERSSEIERDAIVAYERVTSASRWSTISDVRYRYTALQSRLDGHREPLTKSSALLDKLTERASAIGREWTLARSALASRRAPQEILAQVDNVIAHAARVTAEANERTSRLTRVSADLDRLTRTVEGILEATEQSSPGILTDYWIRGLRPWDAATSLPKPGQLVRGLADRSNLLLDSLVGFAKEHPLRLFSTLAAWVASAAWLGRLRRARQRQERSSLLDRDSVAAPLPHHTIHDHPIAAGALVATVVGLLSMGTLPATATVLLLGMAVVAAAVILIAQSNEGALEIGVLSLALYAFLVLQLFFDEFESIATLLLLPEALVVGFVAFRTVTRPVFKLGGAWATAKAMLGRVWFVLALIGLGGWLLGYEVIANVCIGGTTRTVMLTIVAQAIYTVLTAVFSAFVHSDFARTSLAVSNRGPLIQAKLEQLFRFYLLYRWVLAVLAAYTLQRALTVALHDWLASPIELGSLQFSLGSGLTLVLGVVLAVVVARVLRFLLDVELLPRTGLRIGTASAIASGTYFMAASAGIFLSIAAAGMQLGKVAILVSALGVGIGFGLQNIVQNFVAGLILLFGRPINVGDVVEVKGLTGRVSQVGARASTIRTFQGAEVIVPNSFFISDQVINWTLSDESRRIDLDIGVAYGTDPKRVIQLVREVVEAHPHVLGIPPVDVFFMGFGDSALNFQVRAWTRRSDIWVNIRSDLGIAIHRALVDAGISIPFPQRDVYLHTVPSTTEGAPAPPALTPTASEPTPNV